MAKAVLLLGSFVATSLALFLAPIQAAKKVSVEHTIVDGHSYKIIRYDDNSVKVVPHMINWSTPQYSVISRMRQAVKQVTGCEIKDDFVSDARLVGNLACPSAKAEG